MNINAILDKYQPEVLAKLTDDKLYELLLPYIPAARAAQLPEEKAHKEGVEVKYVKSMLTKLGTAELERMIKAHQ
jgi:hypothetical protein